MRSRISTITLPDDPFKLQSSGGRYLRFKKSSSELQFDSSSTSAVMSDVKIGCREYACLVILFATNLLNYMDRYTVAGVLTQIQAFFSIDDALAGLLQTVFIVFYMVFAPLCGFLGDRFNRKWIMTVGIALWLTAVLASSFVTANLFWLFLLLRGIVGIGEASYATIAPTIIGDMFALCVRSRALMFFYFAIPVGSGLGYMVSSHVASLLGGWQWGIRVTPVFGSFCLAMIVLVMKEPQRGEAEKAIGAVAATDVQESSYWEDIKAIVKIPTYVAATIAYTSVVFVTGTLSWWGPAAVEHSTAMEERLNNTSQLSTDEKNSITFYFGAVTVAGGIVGVSAGTILAQLWSQGRWCFRPIQTARANPLVCVIGSVFGVPFLFAGLHLIAVRGKLAWLFFFLTITALCLNWAINVDMLLDIIVPQRRSVANSWQILISHLFGDASGPYIIGLVSDYIRGSDDSPAANFLSLLNAFYIPNVILILSAVFFFVAASFFLRDRNICREQMGYSTSSATFDGKEVKIGNGTVNEAFQ